MMITQPSQLIQVLSEVTQLLRSSQESDWTPFGPKEIIATLERELSSLHISKDLVDANELAFLFAPTGPIQEISMANNWTKAYLALSEKFDALVSN